MGKVHKPNQHQWSSSMVSLLSTTKIHHEGTSKHHEGISKSIHPSDFKVIVQDSWTLPTNLWSSSMGTLISTRNHKKISSVIGITTYYQLEFKYGHSTLQRFKSLKSLSLKCNDPLQFTSMDNFTT